MKSVLQLVGTLESTISVLLAKTSWTVRALLLLTFLLVPGSLLLQILLKKWNTFRTGYRQRAIDAVSWRPGFRPKHGSRRWLIHTSHDPRESNEAMYEYSLYGFVILLTGLAVIFYLEGSHDQQISSLNIYAGAIYFGLLGWAFHRLNAVYRRRKLQQADFSGWDADNFSVPTELVRDDGKTAAPEPARELAPVYATEPARSIMGLTFAQAAIALVVFITACVTFTWAFTILR